MQVVFSGVLVALSIFYTIYGLRYEYWTNSGQVGAGFFPVWLGGFLILFTCILLVQSVKEFRQETRKVSPDLMTLLYIIGLTAAFLASLKFLGAVLAMIIYSFMVLLVLNRERLILNIAISLLVPLSAYFLLDVWLNAGFPKGIFGF